MTVRINIGCGKTPTNGWINFDNSPAIKLANSPFLYFSTGLVDNHIPSVFNVFLPSK